MTRLMGQERPREAFLAAMASDTLHHAWLLTGPRGVGKATFAHAAALRLLAGGAGETLPLALDPPPGRTRYLVEAGSHPDLRILKRKAKTKKGDDSEGDEPSNGAVPEADLARNIDVAQVRALLPMLGQSASLSSRRVVIIDAADDLEASGANALLKNLEEPPAGTTFFLVAHQPGRLLPTIRSRCRLLRFDPLDDTMLKHVLTAELPEASSAEIDALIRAGEGSPGKALGYAGLDLASLETALAEIAATGDPSNVVRQKLARTLGGRGAELRYYAFLERVPAFIGAAARCRTGPALARALDAYDAARLVVSAARPLSMLVDATVFELSSLVARLASGGTPG